jgi:hypothetical protein
MTDLEAIKKQMDGPERYPFSRELANKLVRELVAEVEKWKLEAESAIAYAGDLGAELHPLTEQHAKAVEENEKLKKLLKQEVFVCPKIEDAKAQSILKELGVKDDDR